MIMEDPSKSPLREVSSDEVDLVLSVSSEELFGGETVGSVSVVVVGPLFGNDSTFGLEARGEGDLKDSDSPCRTELSGGRRDSDSSRGKAIPYSCF